MAAVIATIKVALNDPGYAHKLNVQEIRFMQILLRDHPEAFRDIQCIMEEIMADGRVDIFDLPNLIRLCSQIYHHRLVGYAIQQVGVISLVRFTLDALLDSGLLPVNGAARDVLKKVIDSSLDLLATNVSEIPVLIKKSGIAKYFQCCKKPSTPSSPSAPTPCPAPSSFPSDPCVPSVPCPAPPSPPSIQYPVPIVALPIPSVPESPIPFIVDTVPVQTTQLVPPILPVQHQTSPPPPCAECVCIGCGCKPL